MPKIYDAWEITKYYKQKMWTIDNVVSIEKLKESCRSGLAITTKIRELNHKTKNLFL
jgi:hypothetical protein